MGSPELAQYADFYADMTRRFGLTDSLELWRDIRATASAHARAGGRHLQRGDGKRRARHLDHAGRELC
jgi:hypothetical protein